MDYLNNVFTMFLGLERVSCVAVCIEGQKALKNILICVSNMIAGLNGFEMTWEWVINDRIFGWAIPLNWNL